MGIAFSGCGLYAPARGGGPGIHLPRAQYGKGRARRCGREIETACRGEIDAARDRTRNERDATARTQRLLDTPERIGILASLNKDKISHSEAELREAMPIGMAEISNGPARHDENDGTRPPPLTQGHQGEGEPEGCRAMRISGRDLIEDADGKTVARKMSVEIAKGQSRALPAFLRLPATLEFEQRGTQAGDLLLFLR